MRAVLDTVVFVRALMNPHGRWGALLARADEFELITSAELMLKVLAVIHRPELKHRLSRLSGVPPLPRLLQLLEAADVVAPASGVNVCRDPDDDKLFACALAGRAGYIVSEDSDVLAVAEHDGVKTVTAAQFLDLLDQGT